MSDGLRSVDEHLATILSATTPLADFGQPLLDALDLATAEEVVATMQLPRFDNSAMDGYAVYQRDVVTASDESPVKLRVVGEIGAGQATGGIDILPEGTAAKIFADGVIEADNLPLTVTNCRRVWRHRRQLSQPDGQFHLPRNDIGILPGASSRQIDCRLIFAFGVVKSLGKLRIRDGIEIIAVSKRIDIRVTFKDQVPEISAGGVIVIVRQRVAKVAGSQQQLAPGVSR